MTTRFLSDPTWRTAYLGADTRWNVDVLHRLAGRRRLSAADWDRLEALRDLDPDDAVEVFLKEAA